MAEIKTQCPHCGIRYWVDAEFTGESVECEECGRVFIIVPISAAPRTGAAGSAPAAPAPAAPGKEKPADLFSLAKHDELTVPDLGLELVRIEAGTFMQGSETGFPEEAPVHTVHITRAFWIGKYPVTQAQYERIMGRNPSYSVEPENPVETVSWYEAREFCRRLTEREFIAGRLPREARFRLPYECQWEYACRTLPPIGPRRGRGKMMHETTDYCYGDDPEQLGDYAWFLANSNGHPHPVGRKKPSPRGLFDLHGNVGEWCQDWFGPYSAAEVSDPEGPPDGQRKVRRGGCWVSIGKRCRGSDRVGVLPGVRCALVGFRVVLIEP